MARTETVKARIEPELKAEGEAVLAAIGLNTTEAITMFFKQVVLRQGLPFEAKIPNAETIAALEEDLSDQTPMSFEEFKAEVNQIADEVRKGSKSASR